MEDRLLYDSLVSYYTLLKKAGYCDYSEVSKLVVLDFVNDMQKELLAVSNTRTKEYLEIIHKVIACLKQSSCIIPGTFGMC